MKYLDNYLKEMFKVSKKRNTIITFTFFFYNIIQSQMSSREKLIIQMLLFVKRIFDLLTCDGFYSSFSQYCMNVKAPFHHFLQLLLKLNFLWGILFTTKTNSKKLFLGKKN